MRTTALLVAVLASAGLLGWHFGGTLRPNPAEATGTLTASPANAFLDGSKEGETGRIAFALANRSTRPITILNVGRSCACVVASELNGKRLEPGEECHLEVRMSIPARGVEKQQIEVLHDGPGSPLLLAVEVLGRKHLPYVLKTPIRQVPFFGITSPAATATFSITTCEPLNGEPWVRALTCDLPEVTVEPLQVTDNPTGNAIVRTYQYRIGWSRLPSASEFHGRLSLVVADTSGSPISAGSVVGTKPAHDATAAK